MLEPACVSGEVEFIKADIESFSRVICNIENCVKINGNVNKVIPHFAEPLYLPH